MDWKQPDHPKRKIVILKLARMHGIKAAKFEDIPDAFRVFYSHYKYVDLIRPLLTSDRIKYQSTYGQLAIKYGVSKRTVEYHFCCASRFVIINEEEE